MVRLVLIKILGVAATVFYLAGESVLAASVPQAITVCYDFSCKNMQLVRLNKSHWERVAGLFYLNGSAQEERQRIKQAIAMLESIVGQYAPTYRDVGMNWPYENEELGNMPGQMDCIDESINTTTYLRLMETHGLIKYHKVLGRAYRKTLFNQHWAAEIVEMLDGQVYVVDSWFKDNGELPYLVKSEVWHDLSIY